MDRIKLIWLGPYPLDQIKGLQLNKTMIGHGMWLLNLANEIRKRSDIDFHVITYSAHINKDVQVFEDAITFHVLKYQMPFIKKGFPFFFRIDVLSWYFPLVGRIEKLLIKIKPDIIHAHGTESCYTLAANRYKKCPSIISIQGIINEYFKISPTFEYQLQKIIEKNSIINGINFGCRTEWDSSFVRLINPAANIIFLPEAIGKCFFEKQWEGAGLHMITFVGSIISRKGVADLIKACAIVKHEYPNFLLNIIGNGQSDYVTKMKELIDKLGLTQNVIWHGNCNSERIADLLQYTTVYVLPTYSDNSPNSLCEAMAVGVPSVAYSTGGVPSLITNLVDGFLVVPGNIEGLGLTINKILSDYEKQIQISFSARKRGIERNEPVGVSELYIYTYKRLIQHL